MLSEALRPLPYAPFGALLHLGELPPGALRADRPGRALPGGLLVYMPDTPAAKAHLAMLAQQGTELPPESTRLLLEGVPEAAALRRLHLAGVEVGVYLPSEHPAGTPNRLGIEGLKPSRALDALRRLHTLVANPFVLADGGRVQDALHFLELILPMADRLYFLESEAGARPEEQDLRARFAQMKA